MKTFIKKILINIIIVFLEFVPVVLAFLLLYIFLNVPYMAEYPNPSFIWKLLLMSTICLAFLTICIIPLSNFLDGLRLKLKDYLKKNGAIRKP